MRPYLIHSYECSNYGRHGLEEWDVIYCEDKDEAELIAFEAALNVIYDSPEIYNTLYNEGVKGWNLGADITHDEDEREDWIDGYIDDIAQDMAMYDVWPLQEGIDYGKILENYGMYPNYLEIKELYEQKQEEV